MDDLTRQVHKLTRDLIRSDPLLVALGRMLAPELNVKFAKMDADIKAKKSQPVEYCPGCGEPSSWLPDLCPECLAVNA